MKKKLLILLSFVVLLCGQISAKYKGNYWDVWERGISATLFSLENSSLIYQKPLYYYPGFRVEYIYNRNSDKVGGYWLMELGGRGFDYTKKNSPIIAGEQSLLAFHFSGGWNVRLLLPEKSPFEIMAHVGLNWSGVVAESNYTLLKRQIDIDKDILGIAVGLDFGFKFQYQFSYLGALYVQALLRPSIISNSYNPLVLFYTFTPLSAGLALRLR